MSGVSTGVLTLTVVLSKGKTFSGLLSYNVGRTYFWGGIIFFLPCCYGILKSKWIENLVLEQTFVILVLSNVTWNYHFFKKVPVKSVEVVSPVLRLNKYPSLEGGEEISAII